MAGTIEFDITPNPLSVEEKKQVTFELTGDVDSIISESSNPEIFTVSDKTITGVAPGSGKLTIIASKEGLDDTEKQFDITVSAAPLENIDFNINPASITVEKGKQASFTIEGDVDSFVSESLATDKFTVVDKTVSGVAQGAGKLKIVAKKSGKADTEKQFDVTVTEPTPPPEVEFDITPSSLTVEEKKQVSFEVTGDVDSFTSESLATDKFTVDNKIITGVSAGSGKLRITAKKTGMTDKTKEFNVTVTAAPLENIDFNINPASITVEKGKQTTFEIIGDVDSFVSKSLTPNIFTVKNKTIIGVNVGTGELDITASKEGKADTEKQFDVTVNAASEPGSDDKPNAGINVYEHATVEEAMKAYIDSTKKWTNESKLNLNTSVRVTCVDKISTGTFTKSLTCKQLITEMIRRKIGNTKFINDARAKSFIALVRDLTPSTYGSNISTNHKNMIIRYVIEGQGLDINK